MKAHSCCGLLIQNYQFFSSEMSEITKHFLKLTCLRFAFCNCISYFAFCNCISHFAITGHLFCNNRTIPNYKFQAFFPIQIALKSATNFIMIKNLDFIFDDDFSSWRFFQYFLLGIECKRNQMKFDDLNFKFPSVSLAFNS